MEASRLDTDAGLAPMSSLGVVSVHVLLVLYSSGGPRIGDSVVEGAVEHT